MMFNGVVGLDLSLRRTVALYIPIKWTPGDWDKVTTLAVGFDVKVGDHLGAAQRLASISSAVKDFVFAHRIRSILPKVFVEDHAYSKSAKVGMKTAELHGAVKSMLMLGGICVVPYGAGAARSTFLGRKFWPKRGSGEKVAVVTHDKLRELGAPWKLADEGDAFVICNFARSHLGLSFIALS